MRRTTLILLVIIQLLIFAAWPSDKTVASESAVLRVVQIGLVKGLFGLRRPDSGSGQKPDSDTGTSRRTALTIS